MVTSMSKVFFGYNSTLAIDGQDRYDLDTCNCCSVTGDKHATSVWWSLDLRKIYPLEEIVFYGRSKRDCYSLQDIFCFCFFYVCWLVLLGLAAF